MRIDGILRAAFVICLLGISFQAGASADNPSTKRSPLQLAITLADRKYCSATTDTDVLHLDIQLTFTNVSRSNIILFRGSNVVVRTLVSRTLEDASAGKQELESAATVIRSGPATKIIQAKRPGDAFTILPPGGIFQTNASVSLEVSRTAEAPTHALRAGPHILQLVVSTWPRGFETPNQVAARWLDSGVLWHRPLASEYIPILVDDHHPVEECAKYARLLAAATSDPNAVEPETGITALMAAIDVQDIDVFNSLLARGADVNAAAPGGMTPLFVAAGTDGAYLKRLIESGASCNIRSLAGQTPLTLAIRAGRIENVKLLIRVGANLNTSDENGKTPLRLAKELLSSSVFDKPIAAQLVELLKLAGAKE